MTMSRGFGYRINYDKAIAEDLRTIEEMTRLLELGLLKPESERSFYNVSDAVLTRPDLARALGFTAPELAVASETEPEEWPLPWTLTLERDFDQRCKALYDDYLPTEEEAKGWLKKAKADLSRHRRNKKKYGSR
jgi:hypothetical protein